MSGHVALSQPAAVLAAAPFVSTVTQCPKKLHVLAI